MYTEEVRQILEATLAALAGQADFPAALVEQLKSAYEQEQLQDVETLRQMLNAVLEEGR